jgi:hypothetical protein
VITLEQTITDDHFSIIIYLPVKWALEVFKIPISFTQFRSFMQTTGGARAPPTTKTQKTKTSGKPKRQRILQKKKRTINRKNS